MPEDSTHHEALRAFDGLAKGAEPSREQFQALLKESEKAIVLQDPLVYNARRVAQKLQLALQARGNSPEHSREMANKIITKYIDDLAGSMHERIQREGSLVREGYLKKVPDVQAMLPKLEKLRFTERDKEVMRRMIERFSDPAHPAAEDEKTYLGRWMDRDAVDGRLIAQDYDAFATIERNTLPGSEEQAFVRRLHEHLRDLRRLDPQNLTLYSSAPRMSNGGRFAVSLMLGAVGLLSLLVARKTGQIPKKGLMALGLLLYLNRNPGSKLAFITSENYEPLTKELQGTEEGRKIFAALGGRGNQEALAAFKRREKQRMQLPIGQREELPSVEESLKELMQDLGLQGKENERKEYVPSAEERKLREMGIENIISLSSTLQKFSEEELDIATDFVRRNIDPAKEIKKIPIDAAGPEKPER